MALSTHQQLQQYIARYGFMLPFRTDTGATLNSSRPSGTSNGQIFFESNSSEPGTLIGIGGEDTGHWTLSPSEIVYEMMHMLSKDGAGSPFGVGWLYKMGTTNCGATGDSFTADSTFPVTRTVMGAASSALNLMLIGYVTTVMTGVTTYKLATGAGGAGYVNQAGSSIIGTRTFSLGTGAATRTTWLGGLEDGDCAIQKMLMVNITASGGGAGVITWFGLEMLGWTAVDSNFRAGAIDNVFGSLSARDLKPGVVTGGTLTAYFVAYIPSSFPGSSRAFGYFSGFPNV